MKLKLTHPDTGQSYTINWGSDKPPSQTEVNDIFSSISSKNETVSTQPLMGAKPPINEPLFSGKRVLKNIVPDIVRNVKGIANIATDVIPQTVANAVYNPNAISQDIKKGVVGTGEAIGQFGANLAINPKETLKKAAIDMQENPVTTATTALFGIPGASKYLIGGKVADLVEQASTVLGRRALGYTKPFLKTAQAREKANLVADTMLKEHVIPNLGSSKVAMRNVESLLSESGQKLAQIREGLQTQGLAFNPLELDDKIVSKLLPKLEGGAFVGTKNTVDKIRRTILAGGSDNIDFKTASDILDKLNENAGYGVGATNSQVSNAKLFRRAAGIVSDEIDNSVEKVAKITNQPKLLEDYLTNKQLYSRSKEAQKVLNNRLAGEEGNQAIGLKNAIVAAGEIAATGNIGKAAATMGVLEGAKRFGVGMGAVETRNLANRLRQIGDFGVSKDILKYKGSGLPEMNQRGAILLGKGNSIEQEALKYKTPEEFVKSKADDYAKTSLNNMMEGDKQTILPGSDVLYGKELTYYEDKMQTGGYADVEKFYKPKLLKEFTGKEKSRLTDIWNKAHTKSPVDNIKNDVLKAKIRDILASKGR